MFGNVCRVHTRAIMRQKSCRQAGKNNLECHSGICFDAGRRVLPVPVTPSDRVARCCIVAISLKLAAANRRFALSVIRALWAPVARRYTGLSQRRFASCLRALLQMQLKTDKRRPRLSASLASRVFSCHSSPTRRACTSTRRCHCKAAPGSAAPGWPRPPDGRGQRFRSSAPRR